VDVLLVLLGLAFLAFQVAGYFLLSPGVNFSLQNFSDVVLFRDGDATGAVLLDNRNHSFGQQSVDMLSKKLKQHKVIRG
jgi:hypothetical protein